MDSYSNPQILDPDNLSLLSFYFYSRALPPFLFLPLFFSSSHPILSLVLHFPSHILIVQGGQPYPYKKIYCVHFIIYCFPMGFFVHMVIVTLWGESDETHLKCQIGIRHVVSVSDYHPTWTSVQKIPWLYAVHWGWTQYLFLLSTVITWFNTMQPLLYICSIKVGFGWSEFCVTFQW